MRKKIALVTGGYSGEAQISYKSATTIYNNLDKAQYDVYKIDIAPEGWTYEDEDGKKSVVDRNDFSINTGGQKVRFDAGDHHAREEFPRPLQHLQQRENQRLREQHR